MPRARQLAAGDRPLAPGELAAAEALLAGRLGRAPAAYLLGEREFYGRPFRVSPAVLVPRPETETLVEAALAGARSRPPGAAPPLVLDMATGSGCLLLTLLAELPGACGVGTDLSAGALEVAAENARALGVGTRALLVRTSWARGVGGRFDLVLANPPYVRSGEIAGLEPEVREHEPRLALDGGPDGLGSYRALLPDLEARLTPGGTALLEVGRGQDAALGALFRARGFEVEALPDLAGVARALRLRGRARTPLRGAAEAW